MLPIKQRETSQSITHTKQQLWWKICTKDDGRWSFCINTKPTSQEPFKLQRWGRFYVFIKGLLICVWFPALLFPLRTDWGSQTGERSSGSDEGDSDKMCREEGGRERQRATGPDKCPHTQTTTREATRNEQWQQESRAQRGSIAASSWEAFKESASLLRIQVYELTEAELAKQKQINSPKLSIQVFGYLYFHQSRNDLQVFVVSISNGWMSSILC